MPEKDLQAERFEEHRGRLRGVAYRLLGSMAEAEDAVQETWIRVSRADASEVDNLGGWLTTIVARVALNMLRARNIRREEPYEGHLPDPVVILDGELQPEEEALMADSVGLALLVVLDSLGPAERLAFVLHDVFQLPFEEIAPMVGRTPAAARAGRPRAHTGPRPCPPTCGGRRFLHRSPGWGSANPDVAAGSRGRAEDGLRRQAPGSFGCDSRRGLRGGLVVIRRRDTRVPLDSCPGQRGGGRGSGRGRPAVRGHGVCGGGVGQDRGNRRHRRRVANQADRGAGR